MKPRVAVVKFASCDGCQLQFLNLEDELLTLTELVDLADFPEARSRRRPGPYDITFVEGSVTTPEDARRLVRVREESRYLVTIGACATAGGIQALRNWADVEAYKAIVYPHPDFIAALSTSTPISEHVRVDCEVWGCPVNARQLVDVVRARLAGTVPALPAHCVCLECKRQGLTCVTVARGEPCLGPVTRTGCGALCPAFARGCYGCFGPAADANVAALTTVFATQGVTPADTVRRLRSITGYVRPFRTTSDAIERRQH